MFRQARAREDAQLKPIPYKVFQTTKGVFDLLCIPFQFFGMLCQHPVSKWFL
jgi:hypothetical protein